MQSTRSAAPTRLEQLRTERKQKSIEHQIYLINSAITALQITLIEYLSIINDIHEKHRKNIAATEELEKLKTQLKDAKTQKNDLYETARVNGVLPGVYKNFATIRVLIQNLEAQLELCNEKEKILKQSVVKQPPLEKHAEQKKAEPAFQHISLEEYAKQQNAYTAFVSRNLFATDEKDGCFTQRTASNPATTSIVHAKHRQKRNRY